MSGGESWRRRFRKVATFILGAGFSKPAGLPLGNQLFSEILNLAKLRGFETILSRDIDYFLRYVKRTQRRTINEINLEDFVSYLDIEHYLTLEGKDHWSGEGNKSQMIIKNLIALLLYSYEEKINKEQWSLYEDFVSRLKPNDWIFTFNYDTIVEKALERKNIPYRLFPYRSQKNTSGNFASDAEGEIVVLKMHGSINWFDEKYSIESTRRLKKRFKEEFEPINIVFKEPDDFGVHKLADDHRYDDSPLRHVHILDNMGRYLDRANFLLQVPLIISPSFNKLIYMNPLKEFWYGFNQMGSFDERVGIISFSLPEHDEYIRQPLYQFIRNFQYYKSIDKHNLKMVDYQKKQKDIQKYKRKYRFVNPRKTEYYFDGFDKSALDMLFENQRTWK